MNSYKIGKKGSNNIIYFNDDIFKENPNDIIFEDDFFIVYKASLINFSKSFPRFSRNFTSSEEHKNEYPHCVIFWEYPFKDQRKKTSHKRFTWFNPASVFQPFILKPNFTREINPLLHPRLLREHENWITKTDKLSKSLKPFQIEGIKWLADGDAKIFADDMGLGKTLQSLVTASNLMISGEISTCLIVCPLTLISNWESEIEKWLPNFNFLTLNNFANKKERDKTWERAIGASHFVITNYEHLRELPDPLKNTQLDLVIADEAHKLRKKTSLVNKSFTEMKYKKFWALSGTPIERDLEDVMNIMKLVDPTINLTVLKKTSKHIVKERLKKYILRRLKKDVLADLEEFESIEHTIKLSKVQEQRYEELLLKHTFSKTENLKLFSSLREICDLDKKTKSSSKIDFSIELIQKIVERNEKGIVFSFWIEPLKILEQRLKKENISVFLFTGELDKEERKRTLDEFKTKGNSSILLCSGKIASEGLNLTEANHVIFLNSWWNPSINNQARDRVLRIGQNKKAFIHKLFTKNTIEDELKNILNFKTELTDEVVEKLVLKEYEIRDR